MKPFLLLATRADDAIADAEYAAFLRHAGLREAELRRIRLERGPLPSLDLEAYSGVFVGGSPFNASDEPARKSATQRRVEAELASLMDRLVALDYPFFGACYGVATLGARGGGVIDRRYGEAVGAIAVSLTDAGRRDPLFGAMPAQFAAYVGHKEACSRLPDGAVLLARGVDCPVQAFRVGRNLYATQFHPELDEHDLIERIRAYRDEGYFRPEDTEATVELVRAGADATQPARLMRAFVERYRRDPQRSWSDEDTRTRGILGAE